VHINILYRYHVFFIWIFWYSAYVYGCAYLIIIQAKATSNMDNATILLYILHGRYRFFYLALISPVCAYLDLNPIFNATGSECNRRMTVRKFHRDAISLLCLCDIVNTSIRYCLHPTRERWWRRTWCRSWSGDENTWLVVPAISRPRYPRYKSASERKNLPRSCRIWIGRLRRAWPAKIFGILMNGSVKSSPGGFIRRSVRAG